MYLHSTGSTLTIENSSKIHLYSSWWIYKSSQTMLSIWPWTRIAMKINAIINKIGSRYFKSDYETLNVDVDTSLSVDFSPTCPMCHLLGSIIYGENEGSNVISIGLKTTLESYREHIKSNKNLYFHWTNVKSFTIQLAFLATPYLWTCFLLSLTVIQESSITDRM